MKRISNSKVTTIRINGKFFQALEPAGNQARKDLSLKSCAQDKMYSLKGPVPHFSESGPGWV